MPGRHEIADTRMFNVEVSRYKKSGVLVITGNVADNFAVPLSAPPVIILGASAVRDILMPANADAYQGQEFTFISSSSTTTGVLTFKTSADAALVPAVTIVQNAAVTLIYTGTAWRIKSRGV